MTRKFVLAVAAVVALLVGTVLAASETSTSLVGAAKCGECHRAAFDAWQNSPHSKSNAALPEDKRSDPRCLRCHGGAQVGTGGVQCESCHGEGKYYARRHVMKDRKLDRIVGLADVTEKTCRRCHTGDAPTIMPFDWERSWPLISHGMDSKEKVAGHSGEGK